MDARSRTPLPVARAGLLAPWFEHARAQGAPAEALLERAGIPPESLHHPRAALPFDRCLRWLELTCRSLGTEHLGLNVARDAPVRHLGAYGRALGDARTLQQYLQRGISLYDTIVVGQSFRLTDHGRRVRLHLSAPWSPELGDYQSQLNSMAVTVTNLRRFAGPRWSPPVLSLGFRSREPIPAVDLFEGSRVVVQPAQTYIEFPRTMLGLQARPAVPPGLRDPSADVEALPGGLEGLVKLQIDSWLPDGIPSIDLVAETLWTSRRSLQRRLADRGTSYTDLLDAVRLERAVDWLERTDRPVVEISHDLGYADPANFTRAFRRWTGVPPDRFRRSARSGEDGGR